MSSKGERDADQRHEGEKGRRSDAVRSAEEARIKADGVRALLEPSVVANVPAEELATDIMLSIAISFKRLADEVEKLSVIEQSRM